MIYDLVMSVKKSSYGELLIVKALRFFLILILFPIVFAFLIKKIIQTKRERKLGDEKIEFYTLSQLNFLTGEEFEKCLKSLFEKMGFEVSLTRATGDFGADLILKRRGKKFLVQAKRYSEIVGVKAVQEVISAREHYKIYRALVVSNNSFSAEAKQLANESGVNLIGGEKLEFLLKKYSISIEKSTKKLIALTQKSRSEIMEKYKFWI